MTAEKEKAPIDDKAFIQLKSQQILEELARADGFTELIQKGLKSMTHKQFITILQHFLKPIVGNLVLDGSNYVDYMHNFLISMDYPYTINKSSLKTPSAPHCQNGIIILLGWLSEFQVKDTEEEPLFHYSSTDDFDTPNLSKMFMQKTAGAFFLWNNNNQQETDEVVNQIRQSYVEEKIGNGGNIDVEIDRLRKSIDDLKNEAKPICLQNLYAEKRQELKGLVQQYEEIKEDIKNEKENAKYGWTELEKKRAALENANQDLCAYRSKVTLQRMTLEQKRALLLKISEGKSVLGSKKQSALELVENNSQNEIQLSLAIQRKFHLIEALNNNIYKLASDLEIAGWKEDFDPSVYKIESGNQIGDKLSTEINRMNQGLMSLKEKYHHAIYSVQENLNKLEIEKHQLTTENANAERELENLRITMEKIIAEEDLMQTKSKEFVFYNTESWKQTGDEIQLVDDDIKILTDNIAKFRELIPRLADDLKSFQESSLVKVKEYYNKRKQQVQEQRKELDDMNQFLSAFRKINKPFPEDVQATINEVMKKQNEN